MNKPKVSREVYEAGLALSKAAFTMARLDRKALASMLRALTHFNDLDAFDHYNDADAFARWMGEGVEVRE